METIYTGGWTGYDCLQAAIGVFALVSGIVALTLALIGWITWRAVRRQSGGFRLVGWVLGGTGALVFAIAVFVIFFGGPIYRHIAFGGNAFLFEGCDGTRAVSVRIPLDDVARTVYRGRWTGGRSSRLVHEVVLTTREGGVFAIPLSLDAGTTNHAALNRILPPAVTEAYVEALRQRDITPPAAYDAR